MRELSSYTVLFVDDEKHLRNSTAQAFDLGDMNAECLADPERALERIDRKFNGVLITDIKMPSMNGMELMKKALEIDPDLPVILVTGHADIQLAVDAMREGAYDFIEKPFASANLLKVTRRALDKRKLTLQIRELQTRTPKKDDLEFVLAGRSKSMIALRDQIRTIAHSHIDVLIVGETGTGKDVVARSIHGQSDRKDHPFVAINCAALPAHLIESDLFGHEVGAFPGAVRSRYGKFEHAQRGTIFLDEIESMPLELQAKLLQVLQDRAITRLGSNELIDLDVRFLAASKVDLEKEIEAKRFRADLFYRLNVVTLQLPDLSERPDDIVLLFSQFVEETALRYSKKAPPVTPEVLEIIAKSEWPGNVRELKHAAERFALGLDAFGISYQDDADQQTLSEKMVRHEKAIIANELQLQKGSLQETYKALGISRKSLYEKMRKHDLNKEDFIF